MQQLHHGFVSPTLSSPELRRTVPEDHYFRRGQDIPYQVEECQPIAFITFAVAAIV